MERPVRGTKGQFLKKARQTLATRGRSLKIRCFFLEKERTAYAKLKAFTDKVADAEIETRNCELEGAIKDILAFIKKGGRGSFSYTFIDPTGWSGFAMSTIAPLLRLDPGEVLINFMTGHIRRFIESPNEQTQDSFESLFGSGEYKASVLGLTQQDREDALASAYCENVKKTGRFAFTCSAIVLHPEIDRTHFHLIYATRNPKGVEVFKEAEKKAMEVMEKSRADAQKRTRERRTGAKELFDAEVLYESTRYETLRERYLSRTKHRVQQVLQSKKRVPYDEAWILALTSPLVWESDLKEWVAAWAKEGALRIDGMKPKQRVPRRDEENSIVWLLPAAR